MIVPHKLTPIPLADMPRILDAGYHEAIVTCPGPDVLATAWGHLVLEHGRAHGMLHGVWNGNLGNIDATPEERADPSVAVFSTVRECEGFTCSSRYVHWRRAFGSPEEGAAYYWQRLRERWPDALYAMADPAAFVEALHAGRYFTGDPTSYKRNVVALAKSAPPME